ncbi:MAG: glycosyltransferase [Pseudomonadales bacterium]|nr:glycosyltransferase [Pseudomonadales bacterium]NRA14014.1 glycosyltransferase [Oceanospirillaceae bacterium]
MNIDMLVFGEDWGAHPSSTQHLINHLLAEQQILWINSLGLRRPKLDCRDFFRVCKKLAAMSRRQAFEQLQQQPKLLNPISLCWPGNKTIRQLNRRLLLKQISPLVKASAVQPILWTSLPSAVDLVGHLGERACIYYCGDDFSALAGVDHQPVSEMEAELAEKAHLIITASDKLALKFPQAKTVTLTHGVDYHHFATPVNAAKDLPSGLTAGFYGSISSWFDQQLMYQVARRLPNWKFIIIGPIQTDVSLLQKLSNVYLLGPRPYRQLPSYSQHWYVSILPFSKNRQIEACNPLKLREYLAAGRPIVSTAFPALKGFEALINIADSADQFADQLQHCLLYQDEEQKQARQARVIDASWQAKAQQLKQLLIEL